jgi:hypothetical protein
MYSTSTKEHSDMRVVIGSNWDTRWHVGWPMSNWKQASYCEHGNPFSKEKDIVGSKNL